jgi:hypothetical protein
MRVGPSAAVKKSAYTYSTRNKSTTSFQLCEIGVSTHIWAYMPIYIQWSPQGPSTRMTISDWPIIMIHPGDAI